MEPRDNYERRDTDTIGVSRAMGLVLGSVGAVMLIVALLMVWFFKNQPQPWLPEPEIQASRQDFPQPRLQVNPPLEMAALNAKFKEELTGLGWADQSHTTVRIPVDRAMQIIAEKGLPATELKLTPLQLRQLKGVQTIPLAHYETPTAPEEKGAKLSAEDLKDVAFDQKLGAKIPADLKFRDETGREVQLGEYYGKTPFILVLGYYGCPMLCTLVGNGLTEALQDLRFNVGKEFQVIHVSIDPNETPELAAAKKRAYLRQYGRGGAEGGWHLLTGSQEAIEQLTRIVGFGYRYDAQTKQYAHPSGLVIVTPSGEVSRYLFGVNFPAKELRLALVEASENRIGSLSDRLLLVCYHYLPITGRYGALVLWILRGAGVLTVAMLVAGIIWMLRREPPKEKQ